MTDTIYKFNYRIGESPFLFWLHTRFKPKKKQRYASDKMDIVIDGFPRSANSYSYACFCVSQSKKYKVGHHIHVPAQIIRAARLGIPSVLLIRHPDQAIPSLQLFYPQVSLQNIIKAYISFYKTIIGSNSRYVLAEFSEAIEDFGSIIQRVNEDYGTNFSIYEKTEQNEVAVRNFMDSIIEEQKLKPNQILYPTAKKNKLRKQIIPKYFSPSYSDLRTSANEVYQQILSKQIVI